MSPVRSNVFVVADAISDQITLFGPEYIPFSHWYLYDVGEPSHVPFVDTIFWPTPFIIPPLEYDNSGSVSFFGISITSTQLVPLKINAFL